MKRFLTFITVLVLFTSLFLGCSLNEKEYKPGVVTILHVEETSQISDNLVFNISFENFNTLPDKVDVYIENSENPYKSDISVQNGKITFPKPNIYAKTFYVKANNVESNHIDIDFVYSVDVDALSVFINSIPDYEIIKLQVTGKYNSFMNNIDLLKNENKKIDLDLSRIEKPLLVVSGFSKCTSLTKIILPYEITSIAARAFSGCSNLQSVVLPDGITVIDDYAFRDCKCLTDIVLPDSLTKLGGDVFYYCECLETISIPDNITSIGSSIFAGCTYLSNVKLPKTLSSIGSGWFQNCLSLETIEIPNTVTSIGKYAFWKCESLNNVVFQATQNWKAGGIKLDEEELNDSANAAILLRETYKEFSWTRM